MNFTINSRENVDINSSPVSVKLPELIILPLSRNIKTAEREPKVIFKITTQKLPKRDEAGTRTKYERKAKNQIEKGISATDFSLSPIGPVRQKRIKKDPDWKLDSHEMEINFYSLAVRRNPSRKSTMRDSVSPYSTHYLTNQIFYLRYTPPKAIHNSG